MEGALENARQIAGLLGPPPMLARSSRHSSVFHDTVACARPCSVRAYACVRVRWRMPILVWRDI